MWVGEEKEDERDREMGTTVEKKKEWAQLLIFKRIKSHSTAPAVLELNILVQQLPRY